MCYSKRPKIVIHKKLLSADKKSPHPRQLMLTLKRVKEMFPYMEEIEYKVGMNDEYNG